MTQPVLTFSGARRAIDMFNGSAVLPRGTAFDLRLDRHGEDKRAVRSYTLWLRIAGQALPCLYFPHLSLKRLHDELPVRLDDMVLFAWRKALEATRYREAIVSQPDRGGQKTGYDYYDYRWVATLTPSAEGWTLDATFLEGKPFEARMHATIGTLTFTHQHRWEELVRMLPMRWYATRLQQKMFNTFSANSL
jgi:hypothetical protein